MNFFISITTIKKYKIALDILIDSLPDDWKNKYILIYQDIKNINDDNNYKIFEDGHIEVYIKNNLYDYGNWIGVNILLEKKIVPEDSWFLFIHDTCKFFNNSSVIKMYDIIKKYKNTDIDILWMCNTGQCNICLIRKNGVKYGNDIYKDILCMTKSETIKYEWEHKNKFSPKSFNVKQEFLKNTAKHLGTRYVYNNINKRDVLFYSSINMEKYFYQVVNKIHPHNL